MINAKVKQGVGILLLSRPWVHNALNVGMMADMENTLRQWKQDDRVKVVVISGEGESFCSGGDIQELHQRAAREVAESLHRIKQMLSDLHAYPKPTVAALNGLALGGGCEIAAACDFRVAHEYVRLGFVQTDMGIATSWGGGTYLLDIMPRSKALELLMTGQTLDAAGALQIGLLDKILPRERFMQHVLNWTERFVRQPLSVLQAYKQTAIDADGSLDRSKRLDREVDRCLDIWDDAEHQAAVRQWLKRSRKT